MLRTLPISTRNPPLYPHTTLFRSKLARRMSSASRQPPPRLFSPLGVSADARLLPLLLPYYALPRRAGRKHARLEGSSDYDRRRAAVAGPGGSEGCTPGDRLPGGRRSEEATSELQSLMRI